MEKLFKIPVIALTIFMLFVGCKGNDANIVGQWSGTVNVQNNKLNIVFDFAQTDTGLVATMYSVDQSSKGIVALSTKVKNETVEIKMPSINAVYQGKIKDNETIIGVLTQGGMMLVADLKKMKEGEFDLNNKNKNNYEESNDVYTSANVTFANQHANVTLAGTITLPNNCTNCPIVVLVTGSGAQNRDEELMGHKPFKRIADYLASNGIAVLRYDDRGYGESTGDIKTSTTYDFLDDALAAVDFLKTQPKIDTTRIGIIGHSEGAVIAIMAAAKRKDVAFIVSLAAPVMIGEELLLLQADKISIASGQDEATVKHNRVINSAIYTILKKEKDDKKALHDIVATIQYYSKSNEANSSSNSNAEAMAKSVLSPWFRAFLTLNTADYLPNVKQPALLLFGEKDLQVPAVENEAALKHVFGNKIPGNFTVKTIIGVNHLFQDAEKGIPAEYGNKNNPTMNNNTLETMLTWLKKIK